MPMTTVLSKLPYFEEPAAVSVRGDRLVIKPYQIIVWVSLADANQDELEPGIPRFPALLDTGFGHNLAIAEEQLQRWAGLHPGSLQVLGQARVSGLHVNLLDAAIWLHRNQPGQRDRFTDQPPFRLELERGIAVYPRSTPSAPRLPLLGLRGLRW